MSEWKTIDTAPKDGMRLLGYFGKAGIMIFKRHDPGGRYESWVGDGGGAIRAPLKWMHLPPPPEDAP